MTTPATSTQTSDDDSWESQYGARWPKCTIPLRIDPNTEPPPEIPEELKGRSCYYGLPMSDEAFKTTSIAAPDRLRKASLLLHEMGLFYHASWFFYPVQGSDKWQDCYIFSTDWEIDAKLQCPTRAKLEEFCEQLGIPPTELKWRPMLFHSRDGGR